MGCQWPLRVRKLMFSPCSVLPPNLRTLGAAAAALLPSAVLLPSTALSPSVALLPSMALLLSMALQPSMARRRGVVVTFSRVSWLPF